MNLKLNLFKIILLTIIHSQAYTCVGRELKANIDSCNSTIDSMEFCPLIDKPFQQCSLKGQSKAGFFDFIEDTWNAITSPLKPVWGYYEEIAQLSPVAVRLAKESVLKAFETGLQEG